MVDSAPRLAPGDVLTFWFGDDPARPLAMAERWFKRDDAFDGEVRRRFGEYVRQAAGGTLAHWRSAPESALALIILLDQFPRNLYRDSAMAFAQDDAAVALCLEGLEQGFDLRLTPLQRSFFYMPLMHSESLDHQQFAVQKFSALAGGAPAELRDALETNHRFAVTHMELIERFGRFPHRNAVLGRDSTPDEQKYLESPDAGF